MSFTVTRLIAPSQKPLELILGMVTRELALYIAGSMAPNVISPSFFPSATRDILKATMGAGMRPCSKRISTRVGTFCLEIDCNTSRQETGHGRLANTTHGSSKSDEAIEGSTAHVASVDGTFVRSKNTMYVMKSSLSVNAVPNVQFCICNPANTTWSVTIFPSTAPEPYSIDQRRPVSWKEELDSGPRNVWRPY